MFILCIVECGSTSHIKQKRAAHHRDRTNNMVLVTRTALTLNGHEVGNLSYAINRQEACDEDICLRQIELFTPHPRYIGGRDAKEAAFLRIENCAENTGRVETRYTAPVNRAIFAY